jgi:hypothetical protein
LRHDVRELTGSGVSHEGANEDQGGPGLRQQLFGALNDEGTNEDQGRAALRRDVRELTGSG